MGRVSEEPLAIDLESAYARLDLETRLLDTPPTAEIRGLFFNAIERAAARHGRGTLEAWRRECRPSRRWPFRSYNMRDYLRELAAAAVLIDPESPNEAIRTIWRGAPEEAPSIRAEKFVRYLMGKDPMRAFRWLGNNRSLFCNYGDWRVEQVGPAHALFHFWDEYLWIETAHRGGAEGALRTFGARGEVTAELSSAYEGRLHIKWDPNDGSQT